MVQTTTARPLKNIWIAASDGDIERVKHLIEVEGMSPNVPDSNTYTPIHAAASYAHLELLDYLLSKGGNINITDDDGETPLFTVESKETAQWLVERGARPEIKNHEGQTAADYLFEDHPEAAVYLQSLLLSQNPEPLLPTSSDISQTPAAIMPGVLPAHLDGMTDDLLAQTDQIMADGDNQEDQEDRLREAVRNTLMGGGIQVGGLGIQTEGQRDGEERDSKRAKGEDEGASK